MLEDYYKLQLGHITNKLRSIIYIIDRGVLRAGLHMLASYTV